MGLERILTKRVRGWKPLDKTLPDVDKTFWSANEQLVKMLNSVADRVAHIYEGNYNENLHDIKLALELVVNYAKEKGLSNIFVPDEKCKIVNQQGFLQWVEYLVEGKVNTSEAKKLYHELKESAHSLRDYNSADLLRTLASDVYKASSVLPKAKHKL